MDAASRSPAKLGAELPGLIVELVGPSASGKSTLSRAIVAMSRGARLVASARPSEAASDAHAWLPAAVVRAAKITHAITYIGGGIAGTDAAQLLELLPPDGPLWRLRFRRYLAELTSRLSHERDKGGTAVFDQGFITAVGTLAVFKRDVRPETLASALKVVPRPDLIVTIDTPRDVILSRLLTRLCQQSAAERLFEPNIPQTLRQIEIFEALAPLLTASGIPMLKVSCPNLASLKPAAAAAAARIACLRREAAA